MYNIDERILQIITEKIKIDEKLLMTRSLFNSNCYKVHTYST